MWKPDDLREWFGDPGLELEISLEHARGCAHPGDCSADVEALGLEYISTQLDDLDAEDVREYLHDCGAWELEDLKDHSVNLQRVLWLACVDLTEDDREGRASQPE